MTSEPRHPLADLRARLNRAKQHIDELEAALADARRLYPHSWGTHLNDKTGEWFSDVFENTPADVIADLSVVAGEIVFLLRSTLDHLIAQVLLAIPTNQSGDVEKMLSRSEFPIFTDPSKYSAFDWTKVPDISRDTRKAIDDLQPCNRTDGLPPQDHPLAILQSLNNIDKHRILIRLVTNVRTSVYPSVHHVGTGAGYVVNSTISTSQRTAEVVRGRINLGETVDVYFNPFFDKAFKQIGSGKNEPIIPTLQKLLEAVTAIVDDFAKRFP